MHQCATKPEWREVERMIKYDSSTNKWFKNHIGYQTTVCKCEKCKLFYKPSLGHKCKEVESE